MLTSQIFKVINEQARLKRYKKNVDVTNFQGYFSINEQARHKRYKRNVDVTNFQGYK